MATKTVPKKYMLIFQKVFSGQEAIEFQPDGSIKNYPIKAFHDSKYDPNTRKESSIKKNTLAFYDAITNKFTCLDEFIKTLGKDLYPFDYKSSTSYIGYMDKGFMKCLRLSFGDKELADIALNADGNNINLNHKPTMNIVSDIVEMIEDDKCDFVNKIKSVFADKENKNFNFSKSLVDNISIYRENRQMYINRCLEGYRQDDYLVEELDISKRNFLTKIQSYKNFRELYRFRKQYLYDKEVEKSTRVIAGDEEKTLTFKEQYEEARQKTYPKQKIKNYEVPGQISLFDMIDKK